MKGKFTRERKRGNVCVCGREREVRITWLEREIVGTKAKVWKGEEFIY
jgi:hypothetical protein